MDSLYSLFGTDKNMEQTGVILDYGNAGKIKIARAGGSNTKFSKVLEAKMRPYRRQYEAGTMSDEVANTMLIEAFAEAVVLGWEDIKGPDGKNLKFSRENAIKLFTDLPDLFVDVREQSMKVSNFRMVEVEADAGN